MAPSQPESSITPLEPDDPTRVGGYEIVGVLGQGGMARVYLGRTVSGRLVAVKVMHTRRDQLNPGLLERFRREIAAAHRVSSSYTAAIDDSNLDDDPPWFASQYIPAPSLAHLVDISGPLPTRSVRWLAAGIAEALRAVHARGIVHRDLKPDNILVEVAGPRLIDFGVAQTHGDMTITVPGGLVGTMQYMAPEQMEGLPSPASDIFALGSTIIYAATGHAPYRGTDRLVVAAQILQGQQNLTGLPAELRELVRACCHRDASHRPTPEALLRTLAAVLPSRPEGRNLLPSRAMAVIRASARVAELLLSAPLSSAPAVQVRHRHPTAELWRISLDDVVAMAAGPEIVAVRTRDELVALTAREGMVRWRTPLGPAGLRFLTAGDGLVCHVADTRDGDLTSAYRAEDGELLWTHAGPRGSRASWCAVFDGAVHILDGSSLHSISARSGLLVWSTDIATPHLQSAFACPENIYLCAADRIRRVDRRSGTRRPSLGLAHTHGLAVVQDRIYGRSRTGYYAYNGHSNGFRWRTPGPSRSGDRTARVAVAGDIVAFLDQRRPSNAEEQPTSVLACLDRDTGTERWRSEPAGRHLIAVDGHGLITDGRDGLVLLDPHTGTTLWFADGLRLPDDAGQVVLGSVIVLRDGTTVCALDLARRT